MNDTQDNSDLFGVPPTNPGEGKEFLIVGLGASAGGIHALKEFFAQVPADSGMAYVVILHLSPDHESKLAEVLQSTAAIPVTQVQDRVRVEPNHVYVISPNQSLTMNNGHLLLSEMTRFEERRAPVDIFFRTLAESHHSRAVCVILSGTGADGSMGMKRVKEYGGICIVQDPNEAEYSDMPRNSLASGLVDYVLPVAQIPATIIAYKKHLGTIEIPIEPHQHQESDGKALRDIFTQLRVRTGHDFTNYKRSTVLRRIERRVRINELSNLPAYARYLTEQPEEAHALLKDLLISVTNFFRDLLPFEALERSIISKLLENKGPEDQVRVWVAGCATGEEAYSVAILISECLEGLPEPPQVQIFATDIDEWAIAKAREAYYTPNDAADVEPERLRRFFIKEGQGYRVRREVREMVLFAAHNVIKDPPFSHLDLITCRNLLIYLNRTAQERLMQVLHFALNPGGYLFLGTSESVQGSSDLFVAIDKDSHIFRSRHVEARLSLPLPSLSLTNPMLKYREENTPEVVHERLSYLELHQRLVEQYAPPSVVVNEEYEIVHLSARAGRYLQIPTGEPSHNLLRMIRPELRLELRAALYQAVQNGTNVEVTGLEIRVNDHLERINIIVRPVLHADDRARGYFLVLFEQASEAPKVEGEQVESVVSQGEPMARLLEGQLIQAKARLRATVEQHELQQEEMTASNEELQALNEELRSAAEELETSKEELQSVNEELTTVNQELKIKIEELAQTNNDFHNLINSTDLGTIFLDRAIQVKFFTPRARDIFNLLPADVGRPLSDLTSRLDDAEMIRDVEHVLSSLLPVDREVVTTDGRWYSMRILPYRTADDHIDGVVLTFMNITERKRATEMVRLSEERLRRAIEIETVGITFLNFDGGINEANDAFLRMSGYSREDVKRGLVRWDNMTPPEWLQYSEEAIEELKLVGRTTPYEKEYFRKDGSRWWGLFSASRLTEDEGVEYVIDITDPKQLAEGLTLVRAELEEKLGTRTAALSRSNAALAESNKSLAEANTALGEANRAREQAIWRLVTAQEDERRKIARDLHDQLGQQLTALRLHLETLKGRMVEDEKAFAQIEQTQVITRRIESDIDFLAWELRPLALDDLGLQAALNDYVQRWSKHADIPVDFHTQGLSRRRLIPEVETNLYRIAQEALNNVYKHSRATRADVILERRDHHVVLIIEDNGSGFDHENGPNATEGIGLIGMRERANLIGGTLEIESVPTKGTTVFAFVPTAMAAAEDK
jgi:two-component system, chemotaxis family, CheB/CheR fusion protein